MSILIRNGTLVLPDGPVRADLRTEGEKIAAIGPGLPAGDAQVVEAEGKLVFPGFIDTHTHFEMNKGLPNETADNWRTGSMAALAGGTTTVLDFAEPERGASLRSALETWHRRADGVASCHYGFHMTIKDWDRRIQAELRDMTAAGVTSYKVYMAYDNLRLTDGVIYEVLRAAAEEGAVVGCHCENGDLVTKGIAGQKAAGNLGTRAHPLSRPPLVEAEAVGRYLAIAELAGAPVNIVHLSTRRGLEAVRAARARGQKLYVETCPQYLLLDDSLYSLPDFEGAKYVFSPPARSRDDQAALWEAIAAGDIDTMGTDHCSFHFHGVKELGREDFSKIPNGLPGVEHRPALMYHFGVGQGRMTVNDLARLLAEQPARLFGMWPQKGCLAVGSDADLVIFDPGRAWTVTAKDQVQAVDYTPYEGLTLTGKPDTVLLSGRVAARDGKVVLEGAGRYVSRGPAGFWR